jgi:hypothetical protein
MAPNPVSSNQGGQAFAELSDGGRNILTVKSPTPSAMIRRIAHLTSLASHRSSLIRGGEVPILNAVFEN